MSILAVPLIAVIALCLALVALFSLLLSNRQMRRQLMALKSSLDAQQVMAESQIEPITEQLQQQVEKTQRADEQLLEQDQVTKQLEHRIKVLQEQHQELQQYVQSIENQQPEDKLYSRASKLVALGADVDEIVRECDIPLAEAQMLIAVHQKKSR